MQILTRPFITLVFLIFGAMTTRETAPKCDRTCRMETQEIDELISKIEVEPDMSVRTEKAEQLAQLVRKGADRRYSATLIGRVAGLLDDSADSVRYWIAMALGFMGPQAAPAIPQLERALKIADKISASKTSASAIRLALQRIKAEK